MPAGNALVIRAPLAGTVVALADVPDEVFASEMVGPGVGIDPDRSATTAYCPVDGVVSKLLPHAFVIETGRRAVLVHLGVDTEDLASACFDVAVEEGQEVVAGQPLLAWSPDCVRREGRSALCPVVALQADAADVDVVVAPGDRVAEGQPLLAWR